MSAPLGSLSGSGAKTGIKRIFSTQLNDMDTYDKEGIGTLRQAGNKLYKYVKFVAGTATITAVPGDQVGYKGAAGAAGNECTIDISDCNVAAGIAQAAWDGIATRYGWILVEGYTPITDVTAGTIGQALMKGTADKKLTVAAAVTDVVVGQLADATASAQRAFVRFLR